jgi:hypothetical protein
MDREIQSFEMAIWYPIPNDLINPDLGQRLNWYPLAYDDTTHDFFAKIAEEQKWPVGPLPDNLIIATALRLTRQLAW